MARTPLKNNKNGTTTTTTTTTSNGTKTEDDASAASSRSHKICDNVLDCIGETPLVRLNRVAAELECEVVAKCEFFNAGGSVKDRIGKQMIENAEQRGQLAAGDTLIEPTSGNTGIGIALAAAVKGYKCIITMPEKMSKEKVDVLKALGAEIVRTPTEAAFDAPDSHISVARRLKAEMGDHAHILDQYSNPGNPDAHYDHTAAEILRQCGGQVDMLVAGTGTGGTITGIARRLKEHNPNIIIVGVDPVGSLLALPDSLNDECRLEPYHVEGIGYDFIPDVLDRSVVDRWCKSNDRDSLIMMRKLIRDEGLLCGGSSGSAVAAALQAARCLQKGQRCVVILPDSVRNYMTKALNDDWMSDHGFVDGVVVAEKSYQTQWWASKKVYELSLHTPVTVTADVSCKDAIALLKREGFDMVPVLSEGHVVGVVTEGNITKCLLSGRCKPDTTIADSGVIYKTFHKFTPNSTLQSLAQALDHDPFALVVTEQRCYSGQKHASDGKAKMQTRSVVSGIVSRIDLLDYISSGGGDELNHSGR